MRKRALIVMNNFAGGGAERTISKYITELARNGYDVLVVTLDDRVDFELPQDFRWRRLPPSRTRPRFVRRWMRSRQLRRVIEEEGGISAFSIRISTLSEADIVVSLTGYDGFIYRFANDYQAKAQRIGYPWFIQKIRERNIRSTYGRSRILCISEGLAEGARRMLRRDDERIRTIYNPFDFDQVRKLSRVADPDIPAVPYIIHVGRAVRQKRHDLLIQAYKESGIPHKLVLLGRTTERVKKLVKDASLEDRVVFVGFKQNPYPLMANAEALVLSSDWEGLANVLVEALICGTPVVSTRCRYGPSEILTGPQARFLVEPGDTAALATAIRTVVTDPPDVTGVDLEKFRLEGLVRKLEDFAAMP
jgi:glycosyltransferase involved in cell wall biosynthesis